MLKLNHGSVLFNDKDITAMLPQDRVNLGIAFVPQTKNVFTGMTVEENLEMGAFLREDNINNTKAAIIIDGPDDVLNSNDENSPNNTDNNPPIIENNTIFWGLSEIFLAIAAGIISIPVINNNPTILIDMAITAAIRIVKIAFALSGFSPSASANS